MPVCVGGGVCRCNRAQLQWSHLEEWHGSVFVDEPLQVILSGEEEEDSQLTLFLPLWVARDGIMCKYLNRNRAWQNGGACELFSQKLFWMQI